MLGALARARLAEDAGDARQALAALAVVANRAPDLPGLRARMLEQAIEVGDLAAARSAAVYLWEAGDRRIDAQLVLVADAMRRSDWRAARDYLAGRTGKGGLDPIARLIEPPLNGWVAMGAREARPERHLLETGTRNVPQPAFQFEAGLVQVAARRPADAAAIAERVTPTDRTSQLVAMRLAAALDGAGEREAAERLRGRIALAAGGREDPALLLPDQGVPGARSGAAHWLGLLADGFARTPGGNPKIPLMFARAATWIDPGEWQARAALVEALDRNGQKQAALAALAGGRSALPPVLAMRRAELLADEGAMAEALAAAEAAVADVTPARSLLVRYADIARRSDDVRAAERAYLRLEGDLGEGEFDQALHANILIARAELLLQADDWDAAAPLLDRAVALRPNDPNVLNFVGYSSIERRRDIPRSLERIETAWAQDPQNAAITDSLGWAYFLTGRIDEAVPLLERAQRGEPGNAVIVEHLGDAYWKAGEHFRARHSWRAAALVAEADMAARLEAKLRDGLTPATTAP
ncbi:MAG TPA: hypothetical protein PKC77_07440 [Sphingopyxis sp.]|nr:hypothetical protein [Sphingopyxis sp.]